MSRLCTPKQPSPEWGWLFFHPLIASLEACWPPEQGAGLSGRSASDLFDLDIGVADQERRFFREVQGRAHAHIATGKDLAIPAVD